MPRKKNNPRKALQQKTTGSKRKTISPLESAITQKIVHTAQTGLTDINDQHDSTAVGTESSPEHQNKRFHSSEPEYFTFDTFSYDLNMSFQQQPIYGHPQQTPFSQQVIQSPPSYVAQYAPAPASTPSSTSIPPWATAMMDDLKSIKASVSKISEVEKTVNQINKKFADLDLKVTDIDKRVNEVEKSCSFLDTEFTSKSRDIDKAKSDVSSMQKSCKEFESQMKHMNDEMQSLNDRLTDSESRSMRNNLIFYGIREESSENCETLVKTFINEHLGIDAKDILLDRAHRMGHPEKSKMPRPLIARFHYYKEREIVRTKSYELNDTLKRDGLGVSIQRPKRVREARKNLQTVMRQEREKGNTVKFVGDKLFVNGKLYQSPK